MQKIVYILGAGFSRPLGLPVMSDFIDMAKDIYFSDLTTFAHFAPVLEQIVNLAYIKNFFDADLENIEEILSVLEMSSTFQNEETNREQFNRLIIDVINYHTPILENPLQMQLMPELSYNVQLSGLLG